MKKLNLWKTLLGAVMMLLMGVSFTACGDDGTEEFSMPEWTVSDTALTFTLNPTEAQTVAIDMKGTGSWVVSGAEADLAVLDIKPALSGTKSTTLSILPSATTEARTIKLTLTLNATLYGAVTDVDKKTLTIYQTEGGEPVDHNATNVAEVRAMVDAAAPTQGSKATISDALTLTGIVISDKEGNNINNKQIMVVDNTTDAKAGLMIRFKAAHNIERGNIVSFSVQGAEASNYYGTMQIDYSNADADPEIEIINDEDNTPEPIEVATVAELINYQSQYVKIYCQPVEASRGQKYYNVESGYANHTYMVRTGETFQLSFNSYSSSWAGELEIPAKSGYMMGGVTLNQGAANISPRNADDVKGMTEDIFEVQEPETQTVTIDKITAAGPYKVVDAVIAAVNSSSVLLEDATGMILAYMGDASAYAVGDKVDIEGSVLLYGGMLQFGKDATTNEYPVITKTGTATPKARTAEELDGAGFDALAAAMEIKYITVDATLTVNGNFYNLAVDGAKTLGAIAYPVEAMKTQLDELDGNIITVEGFAIYVNGGYLNILATKVTDTGVAPEKDYDWNIRFSNMGYTNAQPLTTVEHEGVTMTFSKGTGATAPAYYNSGSAARIYDGGTLTVAGAKTMVKIKVIYTATSENGNKIESADVPTWADPEWTGEAATVTFTVGPKSSGAQGGHVRISEIQITYAEGGEEPTPPAEEEMPADYNYISDDLFTMSVADGTNNITAIHNTVDGTYTKINGQNATGIFIGGSNAFKSGLFTSEVLGVTGNATLQFVARCLVDRPETLHIRVNNGGSVDIASVDPACDDNQTGTSIGKELTAKKSDLYTIQLSGLTAESTISFSNMPDFAAGQFGGYTPILLAGIHLTGGTPVTPEEPSSKTYVSLAEALASTTALAEGTYAKVVVTSNAVLGNLTSLKNAYVQDATAGVSVRFTVNHEFAYGDELELNLSGITPGAYNGAKQLSLDNAVATVLSQNNTVEAKTVSIDDFLAHKYESQYVAIEGVQVVDADLAKTWGNSSSNTSITIEDANGKTFVVYTGRYSDTLNAATVAQGSGTIKGIAGRYNDAAQLIFSLESDYAGLTGERFGTTEPEPEQPESAVTIDKITAAGTYTVKGATVAATYTRGLVIEDATGYILAYLNTAPSVAVGAVVDVEGTVEERNGMLQFNSTTTVTDTGATATPIERTPTVLDGAAADALLAAPAYGYVQYTGTISVSGNYINVTIPGAATAVGSVAYADDTIKAACTALSGKSAVVTGFFVGKSGSTYLATMATSVVEAEGGEEPEPEPTPDPSGVTYTKITSIDALTNGAYLIVYDAVSPANVFNGQDAVNGYVEATVANNTISGTFAGEVVIETMDGGYSLKASAGYMTGTNDSNKLNFGTTAGVNTITFETDGTATITSNTSVLRFNATSNQMRFRYYKASTYASQQPVSLYKKN